MRKFAFELHSGRKKSSERNRSELGKDVAGVRGLASETFANLEEGQGRKYDCDPKGGHPVYRIVVVSMDDAGGVGEGASSRGKCSE